MADFNLNVSASELNSAIAKANAAAPQATTYTKTEVDTALAAKLNTADVDDVLDSTSANPVQNKAVQAPIARLVDAGAKNLLKIAATTQTINGVTFTVNDDETVTVNGTNTGTGSAAFVIVSNQQAVMIPDGDYWFSGCPQGGGTDTFDLRWFRYSPNASAYDTGSGAAIHKSGNTTDSNIAIVVKAGVTVNNITFKPMLCTAEDYAISPEFVPYAKSNYELTQVTKPIPRLVDSGAKNLLKITATSQTINGVTFTVNDDGTVTVNGTNTGNSTAFFVIATKQQAVQIPDGNYWLSGCPQGGGANTFDLRWWRYSPNISAYDRGSGAAVHKSGNTDESNIAIVVLAGVTVNNAVFKPMLCTLQDYSSSPEFVPYAPSNRELYEKIHDVINFVGSSAITMSQGYRLYPGPSTSTVIDPRQYSTLWRCGNRVSGSMVIEKTSTGNFSTYPTQVATLPYPPAILSGGTISGIAWISTSVDPMPPKLGCMFINSSGQLYLWAPASDSGTFAHVLIDYYIASE